MFFSGRKTLRFFVRFGSTDKPTRPGGRPAPYGAGLPLSFSIKTEYPIYQKTEYLLSRSNEVSILSKYGAPALSKHRVSALSKQGNG